MLKVNEEKILADYNSLVEKKKQSVSKIESESRTFAIEKLGYDELGAEDFVHYVLGRGDGLSKVDSSKLEVLSSYIDEVEEPAEKSEFSEAASDAIPAVGAVVNNI